jgi:hypothetical protein
MNNNHPQKIIIHHSATIDNPNSNNYVGICNYHQGLGWDPPCGYHYVYEYEDGHLVKHIARPENKNGAHTKENKMNFKSIGICVVGNFDIEYPTEELYEKLSNDIIEIMEKYPDMKVDDIEPHNKYATYKSCPGKNFDMDYLKKLVSDKTNKTINKNIRINQTYLLPDGEELILNGNMHNGHFETPIRAILEKLGFEVNWTKEKTIVKKKIITK